MRLTAILLTAFCLQVSAKVSSQQITFTGRDVPLEEVFKTIRKQTGYFVVYNPKAIENASKISVSVSDMPLAEFLDTILDSQGLIYNITGTTITVRNNVTEEEKSPPGISSVLISAPPIKGRILADDGSPLSGASIIIKGKKTSVTTDENGFFSINANAEDVLIISYVGYSSRQVQAGSSIDIIKLEKSQSKLDEVQFVAYGTNTQRFQVGSVSKIKSKEIEKEPVNNIFGALQGKAPGILISSTGGIPGSNFKVQIRGQNTINPNTNGTVPLDNPLIIVDGVPLANNNNRLDQLGSIATANNSVYVNPYAGMNPLNAINPLDIESVEILKDADATAIYGSRGANGVILITTKTGAQGKTKFSASVYSGQNKVTRTIEMMNTQQYVEMRKEALANDGLTPNPSNARDLVVYDTTKYTNWKDKFLGNSSSTLDARVSLDGGSNNTRFLLSGGYHKETFILPGNLKDYRVTFNGNINHRSNNNRLEVSFSSNLSYWNHLSSGNADVVTAFLTIPNHPDFVDENGAFTWSYKGVPFLGEVNPLANLSQPYESSSFSQISNLKFQYLIIKNLAFRTSLGYNFQQFNENVQIPIRAQNPAYSPTGTGYFSTNDAKSWIAEPQLEWKQNIGKAKLLFLVGSAFQNNNRVVNSITGYGYTNDLLLKSLAGATEISRSAASNNIYKYSSAFSHLNFTYNNSYILSLNARRDASSRFGPGKQAGNFGSVAAGWIFTESKLFASRLKSVSYGKIRASYGTTGSDAIGDYQYLDYWRQYDQVYAGRPGYYPLNLYNPGYSWAITKKLEIGLELGMFNNDILLNIGAYRNRCGNQLISYNLPGQTGFMTVVQNFPALVQNSGVEIALTTKNIKSKNFT
ncbi:MAG: SusC/RagA family TonB-linked outer membrane protein, partial [Chitinophagaceae bacterium]|nr:SusC/RagA family TonB-linked outer membrane protein [Chitinophagaceae bacterium]